MTKTRKNRQSKSRKQRQHDKNRQSRQRRMKGGWFWELFGPKKPTPENTQTTQNPMTVNQNQNTQNLSSGQQYPNQGQNLQGGKRRRRSTRCKK
jgi:hypothetical protein